MTCCGVDTFEDMVVAGDFAGNVMIWKDKRAAPFKTNNILNSVRSVSWKPDGGIILIGDMSGDIHEWKYEVQLLI